MHWGPVEKVVDGIHVLLEKVPWTKAEGQFWLTFFISIKATRLHSGPVATWALLDQ